MTQVRTVTHVKINVSSELDADQGEGTKDKLKFVANQLNNWEQLCTS